MADQHHGPTATSSEVTLFTGKLVLHVSLMATSGQGFLPSVDTTRPTVSDYLILKLL